MPLRGEPVRPPMFKGEPGAYLRERTTRRRKREAFEDEQKAIARRRDRKCRWPFCKHCRDMKPRLEVAHVLQAKGQGGDPRGERSTADKLMLLDWITHREQEQHEREVRPLTNAGTGGACSFWVKVWSETRRGEFKWRCVGVERAVGILEGRR